MNGFDPAFVLSMKQMLKDVSTFGGQAGPLVLSLPKGHHEWIRLKLTTKGIFMKQYVYMKIVTALFIQCVAIFAQEVPLPDKITTSHIQPIAKMEFTTEQLFNNNITLPNHNLPSDKNLHSYSSLEELKKNCPQYRIPKEGYVKSENHYLYDFSQMEATRAPQNIGINFTPFRMGTSPNPFGTPPDSMLAVGPTQILAAANHGIVSFNKFTGLKDNIIETSLTGFANFFQFRLGRTALVEVGDPRVRYDQFTDRWFFCCISLNFILVEGLPIFLPNFLFIAFSDTGIITKTTKWTAFAFAPTDLFPPGDFASHLDFPTLGIDANALYIGAGVLPIAPAVLTSSIFIFPKDPLINGNPVGTAFRDFVTFPPQGVDNFDPAPTNGFFIATPTGQDPAIHLLLFIINNPGTSPILGGVVPILVDPNLPPVHAPHKGNVRPPSGTISTVDTRVQMAHIRNNQLFTAHNIGVDQTGSSVLTADRTALRWYQIDITNPLIPTVVQQGTFFDSSLVNPRFFYFPSIMTNVRGDLSLSCSTSAADQFVDVMTMGRLALDPPGSMQPPVFLTSSSFSFNFTSETEGGPTQRWGDYSYTALDPSDQMTMWTAQEFTAGTDNWGIQIAQLLAP